MVRSRLRVVGLVALVTVLCAAVGINAYLLTRSARDGSGSSAAPRTPGPTATPTGSAQPSALAAATASPSAPTSTPAGTVPRARAVRAALAGAVSAHGLGARVRASVVDVGSGDVLYASGASAPAAPASTAKLLTAAAVLTVRSPQSRIATEVRAGTHGTIALVGGGDPTLTGAAAGKAGAYPDAARISDLARQIRQSGVTVRRIVVDDSVFSGPDVSPAWAAEDVPSSYASAITGVMADGGRAHPGDYVRSADPDLDAGHELAAALGRPGLPVRRGSVPAAGRRLAVVHSAPLDVLVSQMLQESDNVIAECLARQVAIAEHEPATFTGAAAAVREVLARAGVQVGGGMVDGSGLADSDRVSAAALTGVVRLIAGTGSSALHDVVSALPVAAWSGTLDDRFVSGRSRGGAGVVRAKTGTLTGVSSLAGLVHDAGGRLLAFAFVADRARSTPAAEAALDVLAARLATCSCG